MVCFAGGLTEVPIRRLAAMALVGRVASSWPTSRGAGATARDPALVVVLAVASPMGNLKRDVLLAWLGGE